MDETVLKNEITKLATNFRGKVDVDQTFSLWRDVFRSIPDSNFIMAVDEIIKDPNQKRFPNVAQVKKKLQETPKFIHGNAGNCKQCDGGLVVVNVFHYDFTFACPCSCASYRHLVAFKCNTCAYYSESYRYSGYLSKHVCTVRDPHIKPAACEWLIGKFGGYFSVKSNGSRESGKER